MVTAVSYNKELNFTVDVEFGFATMTSVKQPEGKLKKNAYCVVFYDVKNGHFCSCTN